MEYPVNSHYKWNSAFLAALTTPGNDFFLLKIGSFRALAMAEITPLHPALPVLHAGFERTQQLLPVQTEL